MYLWRKTAGQRWLETQEDLIQTRARGGLAIVKKPDHKRLQLEVACPSRGSAHKLIAEFGGRAEKLPRDWLRRCALQHLKPINIGDRLLISSVGGTFVSRVSRRKDRSHIVIPASGAFGTGDHATTAMSLRLLEQLSRRWKPGWSLVDLGTGSGILALAGKFLGAGRVLGIDNDARAISIAESNARLNNVRGAIFRLGDLNSWKPGKHTDVVAANLYSDLLIEILRKLKRSQWLIFSGILRQQATEFRRALRRTSTSMEVVSMRRRGKWLAILAESRAGVSA